MYSIELVLALDINTARRTLNNNISINQTAKICDDKTPIKRTTTITTFTKFLTFRCRQNIFNNLASKLFQFVVYKKKNTTSSRTKLCKIVRKSNKIMIYDHKKFSYANCMVNFVKILKAIIIFVNFNSLILLGDETSS
jgi:hypothetical protein